MSLYIKLLFFSFCFSFLCILNQIITSKGFLVENMNDLHHCESWRYINVLIIDIGKFIGPIIGQNKSKKGGLVVKFCVGDLCFC